MLSGGQALQFTAEDNAKLQWKEIKLLLLTKQRIKKINAGNESKLKKKIGHNEWTGEILTRSEVLGLHDS